MYNIKFIIGVLKDMWSYINSLPTTTTNNKQ